MTRTSLTSLILVLVCSLASAAQIQTYLGVAGTGPPRPSGTIVGVVVDETGAPVARARVQAIGQTKIADGTIVDVGFASLPTDDSGRFTIRVVAAQPVLVAAQPPPRPFSRPGVSSSPPDESVYALTYYPGVTNRNQAQAVTLLDGGEQTIVIALRRVQSFHVRGAVFSSSGRSPAGLRVMLYQTFGSGGSTRDGASVQQDGTFDISGVAPGVYTVMTRVSMDANAEFAAHDIEVVDHDVDVPLSLGTGGSIVGRIVFEGAGPGPAPLGATVSLGPMPGQMMAVGRPMGPIAVADDWTFQAAGLYGRFRIGVPMSLMGQYRPVRFVFDGQDIGIGTVGIEVREGEHQLIMYFAPADVRR
jgi:hypothetical protein